MYIFQNAIHSLWRKRNNVDHVDHRVVSDGAKTVKIPRPPAILAQSLPNRDPVARVQASGSSVLLKKVEHSVKPWSNLMGAGSLWKKTMFSAAPKKKGRQKHVPYQEFIHDAVSATPNQVSGTSSRPTQGESLGLNSHSRQRFLKQWAGVNKPLIGSILESHVSEDNASSILSSTFPGWNWEGNYSEADGGRILVVWDPSVLVFWFKKSAQLMMCGVLDSATNEFYSVAFVYAYNTVIQRRVLWSDLSEIYHNSPAKFCRWLLLGDFNQIANADEHYSVIPHNLPIGGMTEFQDYLVSNGLSDLSSLGNSDHSPCLVNLDASLERSKKSFKYFSFLSTHPQFLKSIADAWAIDVGVGSMLFTLGQRMKEVKAACRLLNRSGFGNIQQKTKETLQALEAGQSALMNNPSPSLFREEHVARQKWNFFAKALEIFYLQKSRVRWLAEGDANTSFFHRAVLANQNLLGSESLGTVPMSVTEIQGLLSVRCPSDLVPQLVSIPSTMEIHETLLRMPKNKAPGPDGFPVEFYLQAWDVVGVDVVAAVRDFFISGHLPRRSNATAIALIPKVFGADSLSQFRPVSLCTTLYKVI
ncbi:unnamed protein product, partial [Arabidopsis halleri]